MLAQNKNVAKPQGKKTRRRGRRSKQPRSQKKIQQDVSRYLNFLQNQLPGTPASTPSTPAVPSTIAELSPAQLQQYVVLLEQQRLRAALQQQQQMSTLVQMQHALQALALKQPTDSIPFISPKDTQGPRKILLGPTPLRGDVALLRKPGATSRILVVRNVTDVEVLCKCFGKFGSIKITVCYSSTGTCAVVQFDTIAEAALAFAGTSKSGSKYQMDFAQDPLVVLRPFAPSPPTPPMSSPSTPRKDEEVVVTAHSLMDSSSDDDSSSEGSPTQVRSVSNSPVLKSKPMSFNPNATPFSPMTLSSTSDRKVAKITAQEWRRTRSRQGSNSKPARYAKGPVAGQNFAARRRPAPKCPPIDLGGVDLD